MYYHRPRPLSTLDQVFHEAQLQINQMSIEILRKLNTNPSELSRFIQTLPTIQVLENKKQQLIEHNRHLAMNNLKKEPKLISARKQLAHSCTELAPLRDKYLVFRDNLPSPNIILAQLQSLVHANERIDDEMIERFLHQHHNDHDIDVFVKNFLDNRRETIELRCITEKFFDLYEIAKQKN